MENIAKVTLGIVAVSRDCFPAELSKKRRKLVVAACAAKKVPIVEIETLVENEKDAMAALAQIEEKKVNALVVYLGNFGPEGPATLMIQKFSGPVMVVAAAEESHNDLIGGRGDAFCGLLNNSYNLGLRRLRPMIPEQPVGDAEDTVKNIIEFIPCARVFLSLKKLKIFGFGPRPQDFLTCNAPIQPLFDLGVEIMENSELDLLDIVKSREGAPEIKSIAADMRRELGAGNTYSGIIDKLAQFESALLAFMQTNLGASNFGIFANKCWPAFEKYFGHVPCYINSRLASRGIPVACETDIYGALSEYMALCATELPPTILDINNTVPKDMYEANRKKTGDYKASDLWMGFHCGNTPGSCMMQPTMKYQLIMHRLMEPGKEPDITRGTLEGRIKPGEITIFRLQSTAEAQLKAYVAQGEVLDLDPKSFGGIGVFAINEMERFYRHVLVEKRFPHHTAVAFLHAGKTLFEVLKMLGVEDISFNLPLQIPYKTENPFKS
jgi:L-fucose isomerase-like protein